MAKVYAAVKALIENNNKFLVIEQEVNGKTYFDLPGGRVEYGESPYDALLREVKEEVFLDIEIIRPLGLWWFFRHDKDQVVCTTFLCKSKNANVDLTKNPANEKVVKYYWLEKEKLLEIKNLPDESLRKLFELI